jgi:hypothetical protein
MWVVESQRASARHLTPLAPCRIRFADSHEVVYRIFKVQELPPPEGMKVNELRCAILQLVTSFLCMAECMAHMTMPHAHAAVHAIANVLVSDFISTWASNTSKDAS